MENRPNILVVDTEINLAGIAKDALGATNEVTSASSYKEGLKMAKNDIPDLIILGCLMPRGTSFKLHNELRDGLITKTIPLLVVDVRPEEHSRKGWTISEGMQMVADDYLSSPLEAGELKEIAEKILERATAKPIALGDVLEQMESALKRIDRIERQLVQ